LLLRLGEWSRLGLLDIALVQDGLGQLDEGRLYVDVGLGGGLQELDVVLPGDGLAPLLGDHPLVLHVALVAEDHPLHVLVGVLVDVAEPLGDVVEALGVGDVVHQHDAHGAAVVARGDRVEPLLTRCVPDLKFNFLSSKLNGFDFEVNADGGYEGGVEGIL